MRPSDGICYINVGGSPLSHAESAAAFDASVLCVRRGFFHKLYFERDGVEGVIESNGPFTWGFLSGERFTVSFPLSGRNAQFLLPTMYNTFPVDVDAVSFYRTPPRVPRRKSRERKVPRTSDGHAIN